MAIEELIASGAEKISIDVVKNHIKEGMKFDAKYYVGLDYFSPIISMHPYRDYSIGFQVNKL